MTKAMQAVEWPKDITTRVLEVTKEERDSLAKSELAVINLKIEDAVLVVRRAAPHLRVWRPRLALLGEFDLVQFDKLEMYASAACLAHYTYWATNRQRSEVPELLAEAKRLRELLLSDAAALKKHGTLQHYTLRNMQDARRHNHVAGHLMVLADMFQSSRAEISGKSAVTDEDLTRAEQLSSQLLDAMCVDEKTRLQTYKEAADTRQRAFTLMYRAYENARAALSYLCWHTGELELVAPSFYKGRGKRPARAASGPPAAALSVVASAPPEAAPAPTWLLPAYPPTFPSWPEPTER